MKVFSLMKTTISYLSALFNHILRHTNGIFSGFFPSCYFFTRTSVAISRSFNKCFIANICNFDLNRDMILLFLTRFVRLFSYGMLSVALVLYLTLKGFDQWHIGILFTAILIGDIIITLLLTTTADALGRRNILVIGSMLKLFAGIMFAFVDRYLLLVFAGIVGIISPTGGEIGPFISVEQACMTESVKDKAHIA